MSPHLHTGPITAHRASLQGHTVVFTGRLHSMSRRDAQALVAEFGGRAAEDVTEATTLLVVGGDQSAPPPRPAGVRADDGEGSRKLRRAEQINLARPGQLRIVSEDEFCRLVGVSPLETGSQLQYRFRDVRAIYPSVRDVYLRCLEKWGLVQAVGRGTDRAFGFSDLLVIRQANAELERGASFRAVLRSQLAAQHGQLTLDFRPSRAEAQPAKVIALKRPSQPQTPAASGPIDARQALAARCFLEAASLDDGDLASQDACAAGYRRALGLDPSLVPALVNLANIHYARDEAIEAQALYERALGIDAECFEAHFNLGNIYHDLGRYQEAQSCYRDALLLNPAYPDAHFYLAVTLEKMGRSADAKPHWRAYQQLAPDGEWVELAREFSD